MALAVGLAALLLAACVDEVEEQTVTTATPADPAAPPGSSTPPTSSPTAPPQISGTPETQALVSQAYSFTPTAHDPDGDTLEFAVANRPSWLSFSRSTGRLSGTPTAADVGVYRGVAIQVTDGLSSRTIPQFDIQVVAVGSSSVTISWLPPTENEDGSPLTDLAGYRIRYGDRSGSYSNTISLNNPGLATYFVDGLVPSTYYFVISSYNSRGVESRYSGEAVVSL
jgi:hypothetical protein